MKSLSNSYHLSDTKKYYHSEQSLPLIIVSTEKCDAVISLYGGQVLEFKAKNRPALLWLSPSVSFKEGKAIRGGVPICAPWFGQHSHFSLNHGFARTSYWNNTAINENEDGDTVITLTLEENELSKKYHYINFKMTLVITLGESLSLSFEFENNSQESQTCEWAMHSYLAVNNCNETTVSGLESLIYLDKTKENKPSTLIGEQHFNGEVDRCFVDGSTTQDITNLNTHTTQVTGNNCQSVIVWSPGQQLAETMGDVSEYEKFVCVERGAVNKNQWQIHPNTRQSAIMTLSN